MKHAVIVDAARTPIGRFGGSLARHSAVDLAAHLIKALLQRNEVPPEAVDEVILGQVIQAGSGANAARTAAIRAGLPFSVRGATINMVCASGMRAVDMARQGALLGEGGVYLAGGTESMTNAPFLTSDMRWGHKLGTVSMLDTIMDEALTCPVSRMGMGLTAEEVAGRTGIRREEMDAFAVQSQSRALAAIGAGRFADEIVPVPLKDGEMFAKDEQPRETDMESLAKLRPVFKADGRVTAGNSSTINDGASVLLIADEDVAKEHGWTPRARIAASASAGVEPQVMGLGPVDAVRKLCSAMSISVSQFELIELNEAFAVQSLAVIRALDLDEEKVNVNGGAVALGHPIGARGARIITTLLYEMEKRDLSLGLATLCVGGGMGMAMAIERV